jgi:hypothetical protein
MSCSASCSGSSNSFVVGRFRCQLLAVMAVFAGGAGVWAAGERLTLADLPFVVSVALGKAVPGAKFVAARTNLAFGRDVYEIAGETRDGRRLLLVTTQVGETLAVDTEIPLDEVPRKVTRTLERWMEGFESSAVTRSVRYGGSLVWYKFQGKSKSGQNTMIEIRADGKKVVIAEE